MLTALLPAASNTFILRSVKAISYLNYKVLGINQHFLKAYSLLRSDNSRKEDAHMKGQFYYTAKRELLMWNNSLFN